ncbi:uncharacterized protein LOC120624688 [Pararge aegeria]|uniref:uncharacterized protein LOC120624688 n=1 Tax=Pararge aegeria TaxID=116150 RepID=UPI0019D0F4D3|nr:uncharacterized protein LOC120624688 [Pararge aegeria]
MSVELKEKLIEIVRKYDCIFDQSNNEYRNIHYKALLWERIGSLLDIEGSRAKEIWRSLRDGYIRHKKQLNGDTGSSRKYNNYMWSTHLAFLDDSLEFKQTNTPRSRANSCIEDSQQSIDKKQESQEQVYKQAIQLVASPQSPLQTGRGSWTESPPPVTTESSISLSSSSVNKRKRGKNNDCAEERINTVLDYLKSKKRINYDATDHLFMSYAKTFKSFPLRKQTELKVILAKLFADAELENDT